MKMSLRDFFRAAPGDNCPDNTCGGYIDSVVCTWSRDGVDIVSVCHRCSEKWVIYEDFNFERAVRMETLPHGSKGHIPDVVCTSNDEEIVELVKKEKLDGEQND